MFLRLSLLALIVATAASSTAKPPSFQVKIVSVESRSFQGPPLVPRDCSWWDLSAYCYSSSLVSYVENTMVVQEENGKSLEIGCTVYAKWSHCVGLPVNGTFAATMKKDGLEVRYPDAHHKWRKQLYEILPVGGSAPGGRPAPR
jgi:hypothetical protein